VPLSSLEGDLPNWLGKVLTEPASYFLEGPQLSCGPFCYSEI